MASTELNFDTDKEEQKWNPKACDGLAFGSPPAPLYNNPLDFSQVTPSQLGISTQSFVPLSQGKDKSRLTQLKVRRRSTIGARGSPETNSLIRYIAQQRQKTPPSTPQPLQASPFSRGFSSLKQKMAAFQNLLEEVVESKRPAEELEAGWCGAVGGKENRGPQGSVIPVTPPSSKRRRKDPFQEIVKETREVMTSDDISPLLGPSCPEQVELREVCPEEPRYTELTSCEMEAACVRSSGYDDTLFSPTQATLTEHRRTWLAEPQSPCMQLPLGPADTGPNELPIFPLAPRPTADEAVENVVNSERPKKKRVHFGVPLSPEFFDKRLPPSTPLQKGGTPAPLSASGGCRLRSLLKTPQKSTVSLPQPDFNSPCLSGPSSPPPAGPHSDEVQAACTEERGQLIVPVGVTDPVLEGEASGSVCSPDVAPATCEETVQSEAHSPHVTPALPRTPSGEAETGAEPKMEPAQCPCPAPEPSPAPEVPVSAACPGRPHRRKRKAEEMDSTAGRRPSRSAAISASGKLKASAGKRGWGSKAVDRSLYAKRDYASKTPALSPITETLSSTSRSPTPVRRRAAERLPENHEETCSPSIPQVEMGPGDLTADLVEAVTFYHPDPEFSDRPDDHEVEEAADRPAAEPSDCAAEAAPTASTDAQEHKRGRRGGGTLSSQSGIEPDRPTCGLPVSIQDSDGLREEGKGERHASERQATANGVSEPDGESCLPPAGAPELASGGGQRSNPTRHSGAMGRSRGRRSSRYQPQPIAEEAVEAQSPQTLLLPAGQQCELAEGTEMRGGEGEQASERAVEREGEVGREGAESHGDEVGLPTVPPTHCVGGAEEPLPPWQQVEFCIDDILRAPPRDGRRSVRRSLRNRSHQDPLASGLAWMSWSSPTDRKSARRQTRGRRSSAHVPPSLPEKASP